MTVATPTRLSAHARRQALVDTALVVFAEGSYRGTTTAEIARKAGVSEPILYRHFASKRDLYLSCIEEAWRRLRTRWEELLAAEPDPAQWLSVMARSYICLRDAKSGVVVSDLWMQAVVEAGDDPEVRKFLKRHMREVHDYMADVISRVQAAGEPVDRLPGRTRLPALDLADVLLGEPLPRELRLGHPCRDPQLPQPLAEPEARLGARGALLGGGQSGHVRRIRRHASQNRN